MLTFNQDGIKNSLGKLSIRCRSAFAAACAQRLSFAVTPSDAACLPVSGTLEKIWDTLSSAKDSQFDGFLATFESLLPSEDQAWRQRNPLIENLILATTYACRTMHSRNACDSTYAALQAYEAADYIAHTMMDIPFNGTGVEDQILESVYVQEELHAQQTDLALLSSDSSFGDSLEECRQAATLISSQRQLRFKSILT